MSECMPVATARHRKAHDESSHPQLFISQVFGAWLTPRLGEVYVNDRWLNTPAR
jgi:hypothetical protein